ncbi:hypothetical protein JCM15457_2252 [Liquorilactobacillus sucicola DSM 21376 = JCM 15457]|uniref:Bacterial Pleckstrin homology domain-containing protein n=1 Tax=Liquorilactobacillus sucicola DSM 21376 = JCM 15457 TaxID=1423806 RepID=A0A023CZQ6_9LACO|nr:hypothetical protein [Liquorilactobacillus sucicola]KRN05804.1 hypothetical protein FD15_GL001611 [Liquorilactobacillus sucicola DSM 21376 = JCM 15457]GAJ27279.1 hypothetical protein JCM15457_2252 [Liquorilactobacillus sucicola DSM 21376 = JCM 15457]
MENRITITDGKLVVIPQGINKIFAIKRRLEIPLCNVAGATIDEGILNESRGLKAPGTSVPGYYAGTFRKNNEKTFFNIKRSSIPVVIQLRNDEYTRLILGVEEARKSVDEINNIIENQI